MTPGDLVDSFEGWLDVNRVRDTLTASQVIEFLATFYGHPPTADQIDALADAWVDRAARSNGDSFVLRVIVAAWRAAADPHNTSTKWLFLRSRSWR